MEKGLNNIVDIKRGANETERQYIWRLASAKDSGVLDMNWSELADIFNKELRTEDDAYTESAYRKQYQQAKSYYDDVFAHMESDEYVSDIVEQQRELEKEKTKMRDERNGYKKLLRDRARYEEDLDKLATSLREVSNERYKPFNIIKPVPSGKDVLVVLSDLHIGQCFDNTFGSYSPDIARERLQEYLAQIIEFKNNFNVEKCHVALLGDMISGMIHKSVQINNRDCVRDQIKEATIMVADFVYALSKEFPHVEVVSVPGNHSRLDKKDDAIHEDRLDDLVPWEVSLCLQNIKNVHIVLDNEIDDGIASLNICGKEYLCVHGDFDAFNKTGLTNLVMMIGHIPYCMVSGHKHYPAMSEVSGVKMIQAGSLAGCGDQFTVEKRLGGKPSQTVLICDENGIVAHCPVQL